MRSLRALASCIKKGWAPKTRVLALERKAASLEGKIGELTADIARARQAVGEAKLDIAQLHKERLAEATTELRGVQTQLGEVEPRLSWAKETLSRTELAPIPFHTAGEWPQAPL